MAASLRQDGYDVAIPFDWSTLSRLPIPGAASIAGQQLAGAVAAAVQQLVPGLGPDDVIDLHLIGHSRGAAVVSQAALDLQAIEQAGALPRLHAGWQKMTFLDPHPVHNAHADGSTRQAFSVSTGPLGRLVLLGYQQFAAAVQDPDVVLLSNVDDAEVFYQHSDHRQTFSPDEGPLVNLSEKIYASWGEVPIYGGPARYYDLTAIVHGHYEVHDWYQQNVVPTLRTAAPFRFAGNTTPPAPDQFSTAIPPTPEPGARRFEVRLLSPLIVDRPALALAFERPLAAAESAFARGHLEAVIGNLSYLLRLFQAKRRHITPAAYSLAVGEIQSILVGLQGAGAGLSSPARS
jgi:hypothetical protein